jgi:hypothetical protein
VPRIPGLGRDPPRNHNYGGIIECAPIVSKIRQVARDGSGATVRVSARQNMKRKNQKGRKMNTLAQAVSGTRTTNSIVIPKHTIPP